MTNDIHALIPAARKAALAAVAELRDKKYLHKVTSTARTEDEQIALWLQNRASLEVVNLQRKHAKMYLISEKENTRRVTNADGVNTLSRHQVGDALDVVPLGPTGNPIWPSPEDPRWCMIAGVMEKHGFKWGGRWAEPDVPHYEYVG